MSQHTAVVARLSHLPSLPPFHSLNPSLSLIFVRRDGSHGLDLSFVTHIFLMEEIWDAGLEDQVRHVIPSHVPP